ncbi:hypothetical protein D3C77_509520 [compost metagenome]
MPSSNVMYSLSLYSRASFLSFGSGVRFRTSEERDVFFTISLPSLPGVKIICSASGSGSWTSRLTNSSSRLTLRPAKDVSGHDLTGTSLPLAVARKYPSSLPANPGFGRSHMNNPTAIASSTTLPAIDHFSNVYFDLTVTAKTAVAVPPSVSVAVNVILACPV